MKFVLIQLSVGTKNLLDHASLPMNLNFFIFLFELDCFLLVISLLVDYLSFSSTIYIWSFYFDDLYTNTTNYLLILIFFENNKYWRQTCWILFLILGGINWGTLRSDLNLVRKCLGKFHFRFIEIFLIYYLVYCFRVFFVWSLTFDV